jgi:hypothetical protein
MEMEHTTTFLVRMESEQKGRHSFLLSTRCVQQKRCGLQATTPSLRATSKRRRSYTEQQADI